MPTIIRELDFELCRMILSWIDACRKSGKTIETDFGGHAPENINYNMNILDGKRLIDVRGPLAGEKGYPVYLPIGLTDKGRKFLEASSDEARWQKAVQTVEAQGDTEVLGPLVAALFAGAI